MPVDKLEALCSLCGQNCGTNPISRKGDVEGLAFCCAGCLNVHAILRESGVLKPGVDPRETELFKRSLELGLISTRERLESKSSAQEQSGTSPVREKRLRVSGMWRGGCARLIEHTLQKERGVISAQVYFAWDLLKVQYDSRYMAPGDLERRVASLGYTVAEYGGNRQQSQAERKELLIRLGVALVLWINVMLLKFDVAAENLGGLPVQLRPYLPFVMTAVAALVVLYSAKPILRVAWRGLANGVVEFEALPALGILTAFGYGSYESFHGSKQICFDLACGITVLTLLRKWIERGAKEKTALAIQSLYETIPRKARVLDRGSSERFVDIEALKADEIFLVKAGELIPADGVVMEGESQADESQLTGEAGPIAKRAGDRVKGGSINQGGDLRVCATGVGESSTNAKILRSVESALGKRSAKERNAEKVERIAIPMVMVVAAAVAIVTGDVLRAVSVLVIACPCVLGVATPLALTAAVGYASRRGILISDVEVVETFGKLNAVVFDKTGTITEGRFKLLEAREEDLPMVAAVEQCSEHPLGHAVMDRFRQTGLKPMVAAGVEVHRGLGISGLVGVGRLYVGSWRLFNGIEMDADPDAGDGRTVVYYGWDRVVTGRLVFGDRIGPEARGLVEKLHSLDVRTIVVSGDSATATGWASRAVGAREFRAEVSPAGKAEIVEELRRSGLTVAMIGDGRNDAPALGKANLGIAMGGDIDVATHAAMIVLMKDDLRGVLEMLTLSRRTGRVMWRNLFWAFSYNSVGLIVAACGLLNPVLASSAAVVSSIFVTANVLRLNRGGSPRYP